MEKEKVQSFENHARFVPGFHGFVFFVFVINLLWSLAQLRLGTFGTVVNALVAAALLGLFFYTRFFVLTVQDRVIRLEMRLYLERLLPVEQRSRVGEFTLDQLVALRFAGDDELPTLARQVLDEKLTDRKAIKRRIKNWRPDFLRA
jgi:Family of unknown function (DUF6526)